MQHISGPKRSKRDYINKLPGLLVFIGLLILGLFIYDDFGVCWDEEAQRNIGVTNMQMIRSGDRAVLDSFNDKDHGAVFELALLWIEEAIHPATFGDMIALRHLCSYFFYITGILCGYLLALRLFRKQWIALAGMAMLLLQPRIFAHAFFNSKDVPFMTAMLIALYAVSGAFERRKIFTFILAGAACGFATAIRPIGSLLMFFVGILLLRDLIMARPEARKFVFWQTLAFTFSALLGLYICWPLLWHDPLQGFADTFLRQSRYVAFTGDVLINGTVYPASDLPWYYIPEWICISTPVGWLIPGAVSIILGCRRLFKRPFVSLDDPKTRTLLICAGCFAFPVIAVILLHSVLYDDWRHLYFIYPPFVMIALYAVEKLGAQKRGKMFVGAFCSFQALATTAFMISEHPVQQVYFSPLVSHRPEYLRKHFTCDYWGVAYRQGLEYLLAHDQSDTIVLINYSDTPLRLNVQALPARERRRIAWTDNQRQPGAYFFTTYRFHKEDHSWPKVWGIKSGGSTIIQIYRINTTGHF